jgi:hypothetical protein
VHSAVCAVFSGTGGKPCALKSLSLTAPLDFERVGYEAECAYWLRFFNGSWLIYWRERLVGDFRGENAALALAFSRQKQSELPRMARAAIAPG